MQNPTKLIFAPGPTSLFSTSVSLSQGTARPLWRYSECPDFGASESMRLDVHKTEDGI